ncbi:MAG TPA: helix-turn-helix transcriptional regulator [Solirubrobacteraceae bacterium]|jgi:transcriptional regulator with XRE-family HTH domain
MRPRPDGPVRRRRKELGLTQRQVAGRAGIDPADLSRIERGRVPSLRIRSRVATALATSELALWPDEEPSAADVVTRLGSTFWRRLQGELGDDALSATPRLRALRKQRRDVFDRLLSDVAMTELGTAHDPREQPRVDEAERLLGEIDVATAQALGAAFLIERGRVAVKIGPRLYLDGADAITVAEEHAGRTRVGHLHRGRVEWVSTAPPVAPELN